MTTNRICLGRFLQAVANLKLVYGSPDALDHTGAKVFYHRVVVLAVATGVLGPRITSWDIATMMLAAEDALHGEYDAYADCFEDEATGPAGHAGHEGPPGGLSATDERDGVLHQGELKTESCNAFRRLALERAGGP